MDEDLQELKKSVLAMFRFSKRHLQGCATYTMEYHPEVECDCPYGLSEKALHLIKKITQERSSEHGTGPTARSNTP